MATASAAPVTARKDQIMAIKDICGWSALAPERPTYPALRGNEDADFLIIGGGFTGLAAARRLAEQAPDARTILIDAKRIAGGATARNSGFAVANESPGHAQLNTASGRASYARMNRIDHAGVAALRDLVATHRIDCQWEDIGSIHAAHGPQCFDGLRQHAATFESLGVDARLIDGDALRARLGTGFYGLGVESRGGALLQPAMLAAGLAAAMPAEVTLFENSGARSIARNRDVWTIQLAEGTITAKKVIVAVNAFFPRLGLKRLRVFPLALTASLTRALTPQEENDIGHAPSWGVLSPRSLGATLRLTQDRRILIRNTAEYRPQGIDSKMLAARRKLHADGLRKRFAFLGEDAIDYSWSGNICISRNAKPVFEQSQPGLYLCGCYNASGVARGTIMGSLIAELALGSQSDRLSDALSLTKPSLLPPRPFFDLGAKARLALERRAARTEQ